MEPGNFVKFPSLDMAQYLHEELKIKKEKIENSGANQDPSISGLGNSSTRPKRKTALSYLSNLKNPHVKLKSNISTMMNLTKGKSENETQKGIKIEARMKKGRKTEFNPATAGYSDVEFQELLNNSAITIKTVRGKETLYRCPKCSRTYTLKTTLYNHLKFACGQPKRFSCHLCEYKAHLKGLLFQHIKNRHKLVKKTKNDETLVPVKCVKQGQKKHKQ